MLLPAPFGPIRPTTSPGAISSDTSRSAQNGSLARGRSRAAAAAARAQRVAQLLGQQRAAGAGGAAVVALAEVLDADGRAAHRSDHVREAALGAAEVQEPGGDQHDRLDERHDQRAPAGKSEPGSTIQRISSSTPTIGLSAYSSWYASGTWLNG